MCINGGGSPPLDYHDCSGTRPHLKGATGRVRTGDRRYPVLCLCQLGQDIYEQPRVINFAGCTISPSLGAPFPLPPPTRVAPGANFLAFFSAPAIFCPPALFSHSARRFSPPVRCFSPPIRCFSPPAHRFSPPAGRSSPPAGRVSPLAGSRSAPRDRRSEVRNPRRPFAVDPLDSGPPAKTNSGPAEKTSGPAGQADAQPRHSPRVPRDRPAQDRGRV